MSRTALLACVSFTLACGGAPGPRLTCESPDDTDCLHASVSPPADPNRRAGRAPDGPSLSQLIADARARDPSLAPQVTLRIDKSERTLAVELGGVVLKTYGVSLGWAPVGDKDRQGDGRTPEGEFYVGYTAPPRGTRYHRSILVPYPTVARAESGQRAGLISADTLKQVKSAHRRCAVPPQRTALGGFILIHGGGGGPGYGDWTAGCVALTNDDIEAVHAVAKPGCRGGQPRTRILIVP